MKRIRVSGEFRNLLLSSLVVLVLSYFLYRIDWWLLIGIVLVQLIYILLKQKQIQGSSLIISNIQFSKINKIILDVAEKFEMHPPDAFVQYDPYINAYVMGFKKPYVLVLTSSLVESLTEDELRFVIGHEMGHIKMSHSRLKSFIFPLDRNIIWFTFIFFSWLRKTEYTADRCGVYYSGNLKASASALLKMAGGKAIYEEIRIAEIIKQINTASDQKIERVSEMLLDHPFIFNRIRMLAEFNNSTIEKI